jgi:hypothetical protein
MGTLGNWSKIGRFEVASVYRNGRAIVDESGHYSFAVAL